MRNFSMELAFLLFSYFFIRVKYKKKKIIFRFGLIIEKNN